MILRCLLLLTLAVLLPATLQPVTAADNTGPWDLPTLKQTPAAEFGTPDGLVRPVHYSGEPFQGKPTRIFAWYAQPSGTGPFPGVVLVHGGGGKAFRDWALHWANRGYAALAMDLAGHGPDGRLPDGGPDQSDETKFRPFADSEAREIWSYHAVAAVIRGHSLLAAQPDVDANRIGITGISWGGYLTCLAASLDDRLKVAVPVYGCGFLADNSVWTQPRFNPMTPDLRQRWVRNFDPSSYLAQVRCPILFLNGTNDFAYPMDSYRKCCRLVPEDLRTVSIIPRLPHGHIWTFPEVDAFIDSCLKNGQKLARIGPAQQAATDVSAAVQATTDIREALLHYTADDGPWQNREWKSLTATISDGRISATVPENARAWYLAVKDARGITVSGEHREAGE
ncbi:MAG: alpha/beta fold hydrolase [Planctomyces sp.]|jgi:dienelactone hydrolase|nr:alpha/beta fold hydrolase [Planctomyces sp.]